MDKVDTDTLMQVWNSYSVPYRPTVPYEVSLVQIDMLPESQRDLPPRVRSIGAPTLLAPYRPPALLNITPTSGPAGTTVTVVGRHLEGWKAYVTLMRERIVDAGDVTGDSFDVDIPADQAPGFVELRVDISHLAHATFLFEVTP